MSKRRDRIKEMLPIFIRQYARKHYPNHDPNDRSYDRKIEQMVKRMNAQELDALLNDTDDKSADK